MTSKKRQRNYTVELKRATVVLAAEQGYSIHKAAKSLGINENLIRRWKQEFKQQDFSESLS